MILNPFLEGFYDGASGPESERGLSNRGQALENLKDRFFLGVEGAIAVPAAAGAIKAGKKALEYKGRADSGTDCGTLLQVCKGEEDSSNKEPRVS